MGVATIGLPEAYGGGGGSVARPGGRARGVRARAGARPAALDRGGRARSRRAPRSATARRSPWCTSPEGLAGDLAGRDARARRRRGSVALAGATPELGIDLTRRYGAVRRAGRPSRATLVRRTYRHPGRRRGRRRRALVPGDGGRLRQGARAVRPEDRRLPGGQAPLRRDAGDLPRRSPPRRGTWRRSARQRAGSDDEQWAYAADVAEVTCFDGAVAVAKSCIQVLGGIGFTYEHDAHLYLRRALALRALVGDADAAALRLTERSVNGARRRVDVDLAGPRRGGAARGAGRRPSGSGRCPRTSAGPRWSRPAT